MIVNFYKKLIATTIIATTACLNIEETEARLSPGVLGAIEPPRLMVAKRGGAAIEATRNLTNIINALVANPTIAPAMPGAPPVAHGAPVVAPNIVNPIIALKRLPGASVTTLAQDTFQHMANVKHLWRWPTGMALNANERNWYYLMWCRAARVGPGLPPGGIHSSFVVPDDGNVAVSWTYYTNLLRAISAAMAAGNYRISAIGAGGGITINGVPAGGGVAGNLPPAAILPGGPLQNVMYISVRINTNIVYGIKSNLTAGILNNVRPPAVDAFTTDFEEGLDTFFQIGAVTAVIQGGHRGVLAVPRGAFIPLAGVGAIASANTPQWITDITIRVDNSDPNVGLHLSIYPS
jgi:hypothetical protein